jgi:GNAT superfamily N-acetyltransferase
MPAGGVGPMLWQMPGSHGDELREIARLKAQLDALQQDIGNAHEAVRRVARGGLDLRASADPAIPAAHGEPVWLPDGHEIRIRQIEPEDAQQFKRGFDQLGALSRYRSFLDRVDYLRRADLDYLTHVDHASHEQLVAQDAATGEGVGSAGYVCDPRDATRARLLIVVADQWQHRGVGTALAERLAARARAAGIERFDARTIVGHIAARRMLSRMGEIVSERRKDGIIDFVIRI